LAGEALSVKNEPMLQKLRCKTIWKTVC